MDDGVLDGASQPPPFEFKLREHVDRATDYISEKMTSKQPLSVSEKSSGVLPWVAGLMGAVTGAGTAGALLVSKVQLGMHGAYVTCGSFSTGYGSASMSGALAAAGGATLSGIAVGVGVSAAVYFIPWAKLASWMMEAFDHFLVFLKSIWNQIKDSLSMLKDILSRILTLLQSPFQSAYGAASWSVQSAASALGDAAKWAVGADKGRPIQLS